MKYAWLVVAGWVLASSLAWGADSGGSGGPDFQKASGKSRYQVLEDAYASATEVPTVADFVPPPRFELICTGTLTLKPDALNPYHVRVVKSVVQDGAAGFGPLFPATQPVYESTVIFGNEQTIAQKSFAGFTNRVGKSEFEIHVLSGTYQDEAGPVVVMFRKKEDYLPFKAVRIVNGVPGEDAFVRGYCYFQPQN
jgi:hypothetical protein